MNKFLKYNDTYSILVPDPLNPLRYEVYVGVYNISLIQNGENPKYPTVKVRVKNIIKVGTRLSYILSSLKPFFQHPDYSFSTDFNDIAILQLAEAVTFNEYVQPACMPNPSYGSYPSDDSAAYTSGWV